MLGYLQCLGAAILGKGIKALLGEIPFGHVLRGAREGVRERRHEQHPPAGIRHGRAFVLLAWLVGTSGLPAEQVEDKYPSGQLKARYTVINDIREGPFTEYYENGEPSAQGASRAGKLNGPHTTYFPNGKILCRAVYKDGNLHGVVTDHNLNGQPVLNSTYRDGVLTTLTIPTGRQAVVQDVQDGRPRLPRRLAEIQRALALIQLPPLPRKPDPAGLERIAALRRLQAYRAVVGVPADLELDDEYNRQAAAGAELCQHLGRLDHTPANPGWPEDKYQVAFRGTSRSNLYASSDRRPLAQSVDAYMDDSDPTNIDRVGHRRWCLNPAMARVGFGQSPSGTFSAMWAIDASRKTVPDYEAVAYPPEGLCPVGYIGPTFAWHYAPNPGKYRLPAADKLKVSLHAKRDRSADKPGVPLTVHYVNVDQGGFGHGPAVIFRSNDTVIEPGARYRVLIEGVETRDGKPVAVDYTVLFVPAV